MAAEMSAVDWPKLVIGMLGGDKREQEIARRAAATGAEVRAHGFPWPEQGIAGVQHLDDPAAVLKGARFALFPIPGISASGALFAPAAPAPIIPERAMLAGIAGIDVPVAASLLRIAQTLTGIAFAAQGRTGARMGIAGLDRAGLLERVGAKFHG